MQAGNELNRETIVLSGFFGRGNCGDEAILQAQYERLSPRYDLVISVDQHGAYDGFWNWYPYNCCQVVHQGNLSIIGHKLVIALHVGGGGLPYGFNAAQVIHARSVDKPVFLTGVDAIPPVSPAAAAALQSYFAMSGFVSVRSTGAWKTMMKLTSDCQLGADWAIALPTDGPLPIVRTDRVLFTLREFPRSLVSTSYCSAVADLVSRMADRHEQIAMLPFCPEDERFLDWIPPLQNLPREVHWWNPRRVQREIAAAAAVVSVGRLHPLIFAANVGTPAAFVEPLPGEKRWLKSTKARQLCADHGWPFFEKPQDFHAALEFGAHLPPLGFTPGYKARWEAMARQVEERCDRAVQGKRSTP
jgi:polysaccharide pyruvyl transferase WcaK-like protein